MLKYYIQHNNRSTQCHSLLELSHHSSKIWPIARSAHGKCQNIGSINKLFASFSFSLHPRVILHLSKVWVNPRKFCFLPDLWFYLLKMMELSAPQSEKGNQHHHQFVYPADLRVLGYGLPGLSSSAIHHSNSSMHNINMMSPHSPTNLSMGPSSGSSIGSPSHLSSSVNGYNLPRNLLFSDAEVYDVYMYEVILKWRKK